MHNKCLKCDLWKSKQAYVLEHCESIIDAAYDMVMFEEQCLENCTYKCKEDSVCDTQE
jgi:hypothetical protein